MIKAVESYFGKMTVTRGNKYFYVGIEIEFQLEGSVTLFQKDHLLESIEDFGEDISTPVTSAAQKNLFTVDENAHTLDEKTAMIFHSVAAKFLFVTKRSRPDIQPALSYVCTRVQKPDTSDWKKLKRLLQLINCIIDDKIALSADKGLTLMKYWVDASYAIHPDMR